MKLRKRALLLCAPVLLCGCASKPAVIASSRPFCKAVTNVCISKDDVLTDDTATQIEGNNLGRAKVCGKPKACRKG